MILILNIIGFYALGCTLNWLFLWPVFVYKVENDEENPAFANIKILFLLNKDAVKKNFIEFSWLIWIFYIYIWHVKQKHKRDLENE
jgi:hypothetical protein